MYQFRVHLHALGEGDLSTESIELRGGNYTAIRLSEQPPRFQVTFERASEILATLPRMFIEPDGSFVWTGEQDGQSWQVDGVLYDEGPSLSYVEMSGRCPPDEFDQFLAALGWPAAPVMFQLVEAGVFLREEEFRALSFNGKP